MTRFMTETGTIYEVDGKQLRVVARAFTGQPAPERPGTGEWKDFKNIVGPEVGMKVLVHWRTVGDVDQCTITSRVVSIELQT